MLTNKAPVAHRLEMHILATKSIRNTNTTQTLALRDSLGMRLKFVASLSLQSSPDTHYCMRSLNGILELMLTWNFKLSFGTLALNET